MHPPLGGGGDREEAVQADRTVECPDATQHTISSGDAAFNPAEADWEAVRGGR